MKLGYFWLSPQVDPSAQQRGSFARSLGYSEFLSSPLVDIRHGMEARYAMTREPEADPVHHLRLVGDEPSTTPLSLSHRIFRAGSDLGRVKQMSRDGLWPLSDMTMDAESLSTHWAAHVEGCTHGSIRACPSNWRVSRIIIVGRDPGRVRDMVKDPEGACQAALAAWSAPGADMEALTDRVVLHGTPDSVIDQIADLRDRAGRFGTLMLADVDWADHEAARLSLALMAHYVWPAFAYDLRPGQRRREFA